MPLGWERINSKHTPPNKNIVFIKPLPGPYEKTAKDFLERIAAQCLPIMNKHYLAVVSLEEYEPNVEFWGRNFNNGEVIQLVLRSPSSGHWLPFKFVQMVMIHELAHNKQMNHSKHFWAVRNEFAAEMKGLWDKEYTGEGLWGRGVLLDNGAFAREGLEKDETLPDHLCGGGFRSREKKRKLRPKITYRERRERRERKMNAKYGSGMALGGDEETRVKLEKGKRPLSNPKKANTTRGRELRAAAALARFEPKKEFESKPSDDDLVTDSEAENGGEYGNMIKSEPDDAVDMNGKPILDTQGRHMVRICKEEDKDDEYAQRELWELQNMSDADIGEKISHPSSFNHAKLNSMPETTFKSPERSVIEDEKKHSSTIRSEQQSKKSPPVTQDATSSVGKAPETHGQRVIGLSCPTCSFGNEFTALTCLVCANVLQPDAILNSWRCDSTNRRLASTASYVAFAPSRRKQLRRISKVRRVAEHQNAPNFIYNLMLVVLNRLYFRT